MKLTNKYVGLDLLIAVVKKEKVIRRVNGRLHVCAWPKTNPDRVPTAKEVVVREQFANAVAYSMVVNDDPEIKAYYKRIAKPWQTAHNAAMRDGYRSMVNFHSKLLTKS